jgi:malate dehydrogenase
MSREDLLHKNGDIMIEVAEKIRKHAPDSVVIMVTNPMDLMAYILWKVTGFPRERVIGMGGALDSSRFAYFVSEVTNTSVSNIQTMVMGGHGDDMVPLLEFSTIAGVSLKKALDPEVLQNLVARTRDGGGEIVRLMKDSSAYFAPAAAIYSMIESILHDRHRVIPSSVYLEGEYGVKGVFSGVPVQIGNIGLEKIVLLPLSTEEEEAFHRSTESIRQGIRTIDRLFPDLGRS